MEYQLLCQGKKQKECAKSVNYDPAVKHLSYPKHEVRVESTVSHEHTHPALYTAQEKTWAIQMHTPGLGKHPHLQDTAGSLPEHVSEFQSHSYTGYY